MSQRKELLSVEYHSDDDTGMYSVGEIDFGISGNLDEYLQHYGAKGKQEIIATLSYLIYEVERKFRENGTSQMAAGTTLHKSSISLE